MTESVEDEREVAPGGTLEFPWTHVPCERCGATISTWQNPNVRRAVRESWPQRRVCAVCLSIEFRTEILWRPWAE